MCGFSAWNSTKPFGILVYPALKQFGTNTLHKHTRIMYKTFQLFFFFLIYGINCDSVAWVEVWTYSHTSCLIKMSHQKFQKAYNA